MAKMARKLTIASASSLSVAERAKLGVEKATPILQVIGRTGEYKMGSTQLGEYIKFWGQFEATDLFTGEVTVSGAAIFPGILADSLAGAIGKQGNTVEFAGIFGVKPAAKAGASIPWEYYFESKVSHANTDALANLRKAMPALPKPSEPAKGGEEKAKGKK